MAVMVVMLCGIMHLFGIVPSMIWTASSVLSETISLSINTFINRKIDPLITQADLLPRSRPVRYMKRKRKKVN